MSSTIFQDPYDTLDARHEQRRQAAARRWHEWRAADLEARGGYLIDRGTGLLFRPVAHTVFASGVEPDNSTAVAGFYDDGADLHFFVRNHGPGTLEELEQHERAKEQARQEREQAHAAFVAGQPLRVVTLAELEGNPEQVPTLQAAVRELYDLGGRLEADGPDLRILVPERLAEDPNADHGTRQVLPPLVRVIAAGRNVILGELAKGGKTPLVDRIPDRHVGAAGGVA